jgi:hypothetical protein
MALLNRNSLVRHNALVNAFVVVANSDRIGTGHAAIPQPPAPLSWSLSERQTLVQEQPEPQLADLPSIRAGRFAVALASHKRKLCAMPAGRTAGYMTRTPCTTSAAWFTRGTV